MNSSSPLLALSLCLASTLFAQTNPDVDPSLAAFVKSFKGKGALNDGSKPLTPQETIEHFKIAPGLKMEVVANEPVISQPLNMHFDERGRLWVVQYLQYPFPAGLKILKYDEYLRAVFDKVPPPPPNHFKGKDRITILESTRGDGVFDKAKDFVSDLNIARSVVTGRDGVWILNPPYLLFYPDKNRDDIPDGDPRVVLTGFGLEDTHSGANSLAWGPDGWLYGAHGSTCTAEVRGVKFLGQAIWRYNPATDDFEVFAEGGGNTFSMEFDAKGRAFSGTNFGDTRGMYYPQGSAGIKAWGKHGPLMNPYSFGWFEHMAHTGYAPRFTQTMVIYEGGAIPQLEGYLISPMSLMNRVMAAKLSRDTSTYRTDDIDPLVLTDDRWFRPVDTKVGPDGAIYMADWYDSRLTHVDPRDTWDHEHGRIYRLEAEGAKPAKPFDLAKLSNDELIETLRSPNKFFRQTAIRIFHDRHDASLAPKLEKLVNESTGQFALECFWALNASGGFTDEVALRTLEHQDEFIRYWTVRLLGDRYPPARYSSSTRAPEPLPPRIQKKLENIARTETEAQVRAQLASSAKRFPAINALPILREALYRTEDANDKHIPLLLWWALESKAGSHRVQLLGMLKDSPLWATPLFSKFIAARLGQRYAAERTQESLVNAAQLLAMAPSPELVDELVAGIEAGLQGDRLAKVPGALQRQSVEIWATRPHTTVLVSFALRLGHPGALPAAIQALEDPKTSAAARKNLLEILSERRVDAAIPVITGLLKKEKADTAKLDLINALSRFNTPEVGQTILDLLPGLNTKVRAAAINSLSSRADWARSLLELVDRGEVKKEQVSVGNLLAIQKLADPQTDQLIKKHWGNLRASSQEKEDLIKNLRVTIAKPGDAAKGHDLFKTMCAVCHTLKGEGGKIGPDLTGYERDNLDFMLPAIVDPSLGIREEFTLYNLSTKDGQVLGGFVAETTPQFVTILDAAGNKTKIAREDIKSLIASPISLMPEGLLNALSPEQTRDLFSYLMAK
ncbi:MAG: PVC-type heme-binding CxxCH protein [Chthoniobacteraceae bacterium]